jgi:hypothetical protein
MRYRVFTTQLRAVILRLRRGTGAEPERNRSGTIDGPGALAGQVVKTTQVRSHGAFRAVRLISTAGAAEMRGLELTGRPEAVR